MTIATVDKLNKGTSRDQWGEFNYWGYKAPNGKVRARLKADGLLEVKHFDPAKKPSYGRLDWSNAQVLGSSYVTLTDGDDKGPNAKDMVAEVNALIEGYNDALAKWKDKKVIGPGQGLNNAEFTILVEDVEVDFDQSALPTTKLSGKPIGKGYGTQVVIAEKARELDSEDFSTDLEKLITTEKQRIRKGNEFIQKVMYAVENGKPMAEVGSYTAQGSVPGSEAANMVRLANELAALKQPATT